MAEPLPPPPPPGSPRAYWACQLLGWGGYAAVDFYGAVALLHLDWLRSLIECILQYGAALGASHLLRLHMKRHRWDALSALALTPRVLFAGLLLGIPFGITFTNLSVGELRAGSGVTLPTIAPFAQLSINILNTGLIFVIWMTLYFLILTARKARFAQLQQSELMRALQGAELRLLKSQLNPHFLFNSLNSVRALIAEDPARAQDAVTRLARTLRYALGSGQDELVTLDQELAIVDDYLSLESLRLGERLTIRREIAPDARNARIPVMLLQTMVENAVKHGIAELPAGGELRISADVRDGALVLQIDNPRPSAATAPGNGVGLRNSRERLRLLFGSAAQLDLDLSRPDQAAAHVRIPVSA